MKLELNGQWTLLWNKTGEGDRQNLDWSHAITCTVPGDVHQALVDARLIEEPGNGLHSKECRWVEDCEFWYQKTFTYQPDGTYEKVELALHGLDLTADIWLNDTYIGSHNNSFTAAQFDVSSSLREGENTLLVRIDDGVYEASKHPLEQMGEMWNNEQPYRVWMRKPQYVYGWDWTIWMPSLGIWKDVYLTTQGQAGVEDLYVWEDWTTQTPVENEAVSMQLKADFYRNSMQQELQVVWSIYSDDRFEEKRLVAEKLQALPAEAMQLIAEVEIPAAKLWWPHLSGNPYLYTVQVSLQTKQGEILGEYSIRHGIRKAQIVEKELTKDMMEAYGITTVEPGDSGERAQKSFTFYINDQPIFCKGANHVPMDLLPGRITNEKRKKFIEQVYDCNMNMIRIWGGGFYASPYFLDLCDEYGLMVWHDFMFACGYYPDHDTKFMEEIRKEATEALVTGRKHSSIIGWSGNNEIQEMYQSKKASNPDFPWYGGTIYEQVLPELVEKLSPNTFYRESSAYGDPKNPPNVEYGDQHIWHFTHRPLYPYYMDLWRFTDFNMKFLSEFGIAGAMDISSTRKCISSDQFYPDSEEWKFHSNTSQDFMIVHNMVDRYFGDHREMSPERFVYLSQLLQAELSGHIFDEFQRRKYICSGLLFWTMGDSYGIHNWSLVDYYLKKKPVYDYLRNSLKPFKLCIKGYEVQNSDGQKGYQEYFANAPEALEIWAINDTFTAQTLTAEYTLMTLEGKTVASKRQEVTIPGNSSIKACEAELTQNGKTLVEVPENMVLLTSLWQGQQLLHENHYFFAPYKKVDVKKATIQVAAIPRQSGEEECFELHFMADTFVWMLHMDTELELEFQENAFDLLPGKEKTILVKGVLPEQYKQEIQYYSMNEVVIV